MSRMAHTADDYKRALIQLLPPGKAFDVVPGSNLDNLLQGLMKEKALIDQSAVESVSESIPSQTTTMLPDWNNELGLPDDCAPSDQTTAQQQAALVQKITENQVITLAFLEEAALLLGFTVTAIKRHERRYGSTTCYGANIFGTTYGDYTWNYVIEIHGATTTVQQKKFGNAFNTPYASWGNSLLECVLAKLIGAGVMRFIYS